MSTSTIVFRTQKLKSFGLTLSQNVHYQLSPDELLQQTLIAGEGIYNDSGAMVVQTGKFTGRSPKDRFIVKDNITENTIDWNEINQPISENHFYIIRKKITNYLNGQSEIWIRDCSACADERYRLHIRAVTEKPWLDLFVYNMFLRFAEHESDTDSSQWHILAAPGLQLQPEECGIHNYNAVVISFKHKTILIAGTGYTGEIKKGIFSVLNYILPKEQNVLSMHCAANTGAKGDTALFFGLSGTGKTTLSISPNRKLIGDDEHGWSDEGIFNIEGGCYAKCIGLEEDKEPEIFHAIKRGALVENTAFYRGTHIINFSDKSITENTRVSYPVDFIDNIVEPSEGDHPQHIFFLTCDAFGVLPPISKLSVEQAMYHFISGYTAKVAGTETGITEPQAVFSACFGAPFMPLHPSVYAKMLGEKLREHQANVWLVNTGWTGGAYVSGKRISLKYTRALIQAALDGSLDDVVYCTDKVFGLSVPQTCKGIPYAIINPENAWADKTAYNKTALKLAVLFEKNFEKYKV